jgi:hypothetical protein
VRSSAVAAEGGLQLVAVQKRKQILFLFFVVDIDLQDILVRNIDLIIETLLTVILHRREDAPQDILGPHVVPTPEQPFVP